MSEGSANINAILLFLICLGTLFFDLNGLESSPEGYAFWKWLIVMLPLTIVYRMIYFRLTPRDLDRDDYDFSD